MLLLNTKFFICSFLFFCLFTTGIFVSLFPLLTLSIIFGFLILILFIILMNHEKKKILIILSSSLILSLFLLPGLNLGDIKFRIDDYIAILFTIALAFILYKEKIVISLNIFKWLLIYIIYSLLITIVNLFFNDLNILLLLFFVKEIQYFLYFIIFFYMAKNYSEFESTLRKTFLLASLITISWGVFQLISGNIIGYYGIGIISVSAPSQSGVVLFTISIFLLYMSLTTNKKMSSLFLIFTSLISIMLVFATISRTAISVLLAVIAIYLLISMFQQWNYKKVYMGIYAVILIISLSYLIVGDLIYSVFERFSRFGEGAIGRTGFWQEFLSNSDIIGHIFGNGKGFMQEIVGTLTLKADSQYIRLILEVGVIGLVLWGLLITSIIVFCFKNFRNDYYDSLFLLLLTIGFILIGITQEGYLVTIQGSIYWILSGFLIGNISRKVNKVNLEV